MQRGQVVGQVDDTPLLAPIDGVVRGISRSGIAVAAGAKLVDVDPRGDAALAAGIGERPRRIAAAVLAAVQSARRPRPGSSPRGPEPPDSTAAH